VACNGTPITFTITVNPLLTPSITASGALSGLSTVYGTPSSSASFTVTAANLQSGITITPPQGFEVSSDNTNFSNMVTIGSIGSLAATPVYIRLAATTPVGTYSGNIVLSSTGVTDIDVNMPNSTVLPAPLTITADNKTRPFDTPNPVLTVTYTGFQNQDGPFQLTTQPVVTTQAVASSPIGDYPITVNGASSPNYDIFYVQGTLSVIPALSSIKIPNAFTPNGDGVNDVWNILELSSYPQCTVLVYSRNGSLVYQSHGYPKPWDGTHNGNPLPAGTYYYIISPQSDLPKLSGYVAILR
jgi:gliding motility-associated-like protein